MKKLLLVLLTVLMVCSAVFANGTQEKAATGLKKVTISLQPAHHSLGVFVAKEKGWFEEAGIDLDVLVYTSGAPQLEAQASGAWDIGLMGVAAGVTGITAYDLTCAAFSQWDFFNQNLYVRPNSEIAKSGAGHINGYPEIYGTPDMYKGKTIFCRKGSMEFLQLLATLNALGLKESDVNIVHMEVASAYQAFLSGEGDMICLLSTWSSDAEGEGLVCASGAKAAKLYVPSTLLISEKAKQDPETTQTIINVMIRGLLWVLDNKEEAAEYYFKVCEDEGVPCTMDYAKKFITTSYGPNLKEYREMLKTNQFSKELENVMNYYVAAGIHTQEKVAKVAAGFDGTFLEKALDNYEKNYLGK